MNLPAMISRTRLLACKGATLLGAALSEKKPMVAYVGGWLGKHNLGDEALWSAYEHLFAANRLIHFDGGSLARAGVRLLHLRGGLLGGGTLIGQRRGWLQLAGQFLDSGHPLAVFGTGVEEPVFWAGETSVEDWKPILDRCSYIGVRGPISAGMLTRAGVRNVEVVGDPVITFAETEINPAAISDSIGLNLGTSDGRIWGEESRVAGEFAALARRARSSGWSVHWFVVWPKDLSVTRTAAEASTTSDHIHEFYTDPKAYLAEVRRLGAFVGMKLHATVLATCALTPSIMIEYRPKCRDYMQSIGQEQFTFRTDRFRAGELEEILREWIRNRNAASATLASALQAARNRLRQAMARIPFLEPASIH
jgi:polysaccharide pyruvyl transferase WcaK-like protein